MSKEIEKTINDVLKGEAQKNAMGFLVFLNVNEMLAGGEHGAVSYKGNAICYLHIDGEEQPPGPWTVWIDGDYNNISENRIKEIAQKNVNICASCGCDCSPGSSKSIFGNPVTQCQGLSFCQIWGRCPGKCHKAPRKHSCRACEVSPSHWRQQRSYQRRHRYGILPKHFSSL